MSALEVLLTILTVLFFVLLYIRSLQLERYHVRNRGVNQHPARTAIRAAGHWTSTVLRYVLPFYLVAAAYFYLGARRDCHRDPLAKAAYEAEPFTEHLVTALQWPADIEEGPHCRSR